MSKPYNQSFVDKIQESRQQVKEGKVVSLDIDNLWTYDQEIDEAVKRVEAGEYYTHEEVMKMIAERIKAAGSKEHTTESSNDDIESESENC